MSSASAHLLHEHEGLSSESLHPRQKARCGPAAGGELGRAGLKTELELQGENLSQGSKAEGK